ncbi:hypothetical protein SLS60_001292 [Paraconiothyrium brasiliense]|uniref:Uncharacterized protein n=1 Tax=Paraconiothyrium brasiliense TaxID=300254 RepID=A0ABR3S8P6_9PLEO
MEPQEVEHLEVVTPVILVSDFEEDPPITMKYVNGDNEIDFETVYRNIRTLSHHSGRGILTPDTESGPEPVFQMKECEPEFLEAFWTCASDLCDYFADFLAFDSPTMQSVWFNLLDQLQEAAVLPHYFWIPGVPSCKHAQEFVTDINFLLRDVITVLIAPWKMHLFTPITVPNHVSPGITNVGRNGLKAWQQFLYKDSPGFFVPKSKRVYLHATQTDTDNTGSEVHIPRGGLAIIDSHTRRLRALAEKVSQRESDTDTDADADADADTDVLAQFDRKALDLTRASTYTAIDGRQILVQPRAPRQLPELFDSSFEHPRPNLQLVNESIGVCKGKDVYQHADDDEKFHMLSIGSSETTQKQTFQSRVNRSAYSDMYEP